MLKQKQNKTLKGYLFMCKRYLRSFASASTQVHTYSSMTWIPSVNFSEQVWWLLLWPWQHVAPALIRYINFALFFRKKNLFFSFFAKRIKLIRVYLFRAASRSLEHAGGQGPIGQIDERNVPIFNAQMVNWVYVEIVLISFFFLQFSFCSHSSIWTRTVRPNTSQRNFECLRID